MAGRIRSIKPEILDDEKTASLSHLEWRLFVSLWLLADDHGALRADPAYLAGQAFWGCPVTHQDMSDAIEGLAALSLVQVYEVRGQRYVQITNWSRHQKVDHPSKPRVPRMEDEGSWPVEARRSDRVYFIRATESRAIKIGVSWNPSRRLASLQAGHHERLELIADIPGDPSMERALHGEFSGSRMSGEWFSETPELLKKIDLLTSLERSTDSPLGPSRESSRDNPTTLAPDLRSPTSDHRPPSPERDPEPQTAASAAPLTLVPDQPRPERSRRAQATKSDLPEAWKPSESEANRDAEREARQRGVSIELELAKMRDWSKAGGAPCRDWDARWRNWLRQAKPQNGGFPAGGGWNNNTGIRKTNLL